MTDIFMNTVGMIALWNSSDQWHQAADPAYRGILSQGQRLITTSLVLVECGNGATRRPYRRRVNALRQGLREDGLIVDPTDLEIDEAWAAYDRGEAGEAGIIDQVSFIVMRRLGLTEAFTNDRHFPAAGVTTLF
jgi:predicted nucleic acid-binding protein